MVHSTPKRPALVRSLIIAAIAAAALGALSAVATRIAWSNPNAPVAAYGSVPVSM